MKIIIITAILSAIYLIYRAIKSLISEEKKYIGIILVIVVIFPLFVFANRMKISAEVRRETINNEIKLCKSWHRSLEFIKSQYDGVSVSAGEKEQFEQLKKDFTTRKSNRHYQPYTYKDEKLFEVLEQCSNEIANISLGE